MNLKPNDNPSAVRVPHQLFAWIAAVLICDFGLVFLQQSSPPHVVIGHLALTALELGIISLLWQHYRRWAANQHADTAETQNQLAYQAQLLDSVMDAVIATTPDYRIVYWNPAAVKLYGWRAEEAIGKTITELVRGEMSPEAVAAASHKVQTQGGWIDELVQYSRDNRRIAVLSSVSLIKDRTGRAIGVVAVNRDISQRKQLEADLLEAEKQRLALIAEQDLINTKQDFVTTVSHDFRTPLAIIQLNTEKLERYDQHLQPEQRAQAFNNIKEQIGYMTHLLDKVSLMRRMWAGQIQVAPDLHQLYTMLNGLLTEINAANGKKHHIVWQLSDDLKREFRFDPVLVRRILDNLISNATKYSPEGSKVRVNVRLLTQNERLGFELMVSDEGIGVPKDDQARLFEIFFRATNACNQPGSGLGLAIVRSCVQLHQGAISFTSIEGSGSTFTVWLPFLEADAASGSAEQDLPGAAL